MGKKKSESNRRMAKMDEFTDDDTLSTTSTGSSFDIGGHDVEEEHDEGSVLDGFLEALYEKRASTRETALRGLIGAFTSGVLTEFVDAKYETLLHLLLGSVKRGSSIENALGARAISLLTITAGSGDIAKSIMTDSFPHLLKVAKSGSSPLARISALDAMGVVLFIGDTELEATENGMSAIWQICSHKGNYHSDQVKGASAPSGSVKAVAVSSWALLLSTIPAHRTSGHYLALALPVLSSLLKDDDMAVQTAAREAVSLLYEITKVPWKQQTALQSDEGTSLDDDSSESQTHKLTSSAGKTLQAKEIEVFHQMKALAIQSGGRGLTTRDGECRETSVKLPSGEIMKVNTWTHTVQLNVLRRVLQEGFQRHLQDNVLLHEIFGFRPSVSREKRAMSSVEKRLYKSPNSVISKNRTQVRNERRNISQAGKEGHFSVTNVEE